jgi:hypothetical protein
MFEVVCLRQNAQVVGSLAQFDLTHVVDILAARGGPDALGQAADAQGGLPRRMEGHEQGKQASPAALVA